MDKKDFADTVSPLFKKLVAIRSPWRTQFNRCFLRIADESLTHIIDVLVGGDPRIRCLQGAEVRD